MDQDAPHSGSTPPPLPPQPPTGVPGSPPSHVYDAGSQPHRPTDNKLGLIGFILSSTGLLCACCFPILPMGLAGLICCLIALKQQPRTFAIAGVVIGLMVCALQIIVLVHSDFQFSFTGIKWNSSYSTP